MIKTFAYNDFSSFTFEQKRDYDFMMEQLKEFAKNGGDVSLMVREDRYLSGPVELIPFHDYIIKNIDNAEKFFQELTRTGALPGLCDFEWNAETGTISEKPNYGISWMKENYNEFSEMIQQSFSNLLDKLPENLSLVTTYHKINYEGKIEVSRFYHPLFKIAEEIKQPEIYKILFTKRPEIKVEWEAPGRRNEPRFLDSVKGLYLHIEDSNLAILFYKFGIGREYFHNPDFAEDLYQLIKTASSNGDIEFLTDVLPKVNLRFLETGRSVEDLSLTKAKNVETANILMDHKAIVSQTIHHENGTYESNVLFSENFNKVEILDAILQRYTAYAQSVQTNSDDFYNLIKKKNFNFTKLLIEKYNFPLEKYDMLYIAWTKDADYEWLLKNGADVRKCESFGNSIVKSREEGLRSLRALNKQGLIVSKSPDIVFNIFDSLPTKNFVNYYDKLTSSDLEKYTINGYPAWWGACSSSDYSFMYARLNNPQQTAQDGKPLLFYVLEREFERPKLQKPFETIKMQLAKIRKKNPDYQFDLSYIDENGNNFLHHLVRTQEYQKNTIDSDLLTFLYENSKQNPYEYFFVKNKEEITPLEILLQIKDPGVWNNVVHTAFKTLGQIMDNVPSLINTTERLSTGEKIGDTLLKLYKDDAEMLPKIQALILNSELNIHGESASKRIKL